jgi:cell division topological specificity factor
MSLLNFFRRREPTASIAKERLQIVLAHERAGRTAPDFLPKLQKEVLAVVAKFVDVSDDMIKVQLEKVGETSVLEINIEFDRAREKPAEPSNDRAPAVSEPVAVEVQEPVAKEA